MIPQLARAQQALADKDALLAQLSDIQAPGPASWWPPAPGWWALALLLLTGSIFLAYHVIKYLKQHRYRKQALALLNTIEKKYSHKTQNTNDSEVFTEICALLKRGLLSAYAHSPQYIAGAYGKNFFQLLEKTLEKNTFTVEANYYDSAYKKNPEVDINQFIEFARKWIKQHKNLNRLEFSKQLGLSEQNENTNNLLHAQKKEGEQYV